MCMLDAPFGAMNRNFPHYHLPQAISLCDWHPRITVEDALRCWNDLSFCMFRFWMAAFPADLFLRFAEALFPRIRPYYA